MPSPFPGMNPYLEQDDVWHDFHKAGGNNELVYNIEVNGDPEYLSDGVTVAGQP